VHGRLHQGEYGNDEERDGVRELSHELDEAIRKHNVGAFDGDEFGDHGFRLFMYGPDVDQLFAAVADVLRSSKLMKGGYAIKRYGMPERSVRLNL
jgi:hypothetical protein